MELLFRILALLSGIVALRVGIPLIVAASAYPSLIGSIIGTTQVIGWVGALILVDIRVWENYRRKEAERAANHIERSRWKYNQGISTTLYEPDPLPFHLRYWDVILVAAALVLANLLLLGTLTLLADKNLTPEIAFQVVWFFGSFAVGILSGVLRDRKGP